MMDVKINASFILPGRVLPAEPPLLKKKGKGKKKNNFTKEEDIKVYSPNKSLFSPKKSIYLNIFI